MADHPDPPPGRAPQPLLIGIDEAARLLGVGRTTAYAEARQGRLRVVHIGRRTLVSTEALSSYLALLEREAAEHRAPR